MTAVATRGREDEGISRGRIAMSLSQPTRPGSARPGCTSCLLFAANNAAVFNKMLPYSPGHKANINYEGASCRGHDEEKKMVLTGTHTAPP